MVLARRGMACTSHPLASLAAVESLRGGGNAIDAAVAATALLGVVEPFSTGIGGDCFMLVWSARERRLFGLNGSGRAPRRATVEALRAAGHTTMPMLGMASVTVPGAVDAWACALERFGKRSLAEALAPAIAYASEGFPATEVVSAQWAFGAGLLQTPGGKEAFAPPRLGAVTRLPELAHSLRQIAEGGPEILYRGALAERIIAFSDAHGGLLEAADLADHASTWVAPIATTYRGYTVHEIPPNGQGLAVLLALNILEQFDVGAESDPAVATHLRIEAVKLAYADRDRYLADPEIAPVPVEALLAQSYARGRAQTIRRDAAAVEVGPGAPLAGTDTVYLTTADAEGNVVSCINSLFFPFGSGMVVDGTGIALQNRAFGFSLDPRHPNCIGPGKRPFHTIIPAMICRDGRPVVSFGVMGGNVQAQAQVQVVSRLLDHGANIQEALDAPRFHYLDGRRVAVEGTFGPGVRQALTALGHEVQDEAAALPYGGFGGGQGIMIDPMTGAFWGGSDERKDGSAIGF